MLPAHILISGANIGQKQKAQLLFLIALSSLLRVKELANATAHGLPNVELMHFQLKSCRCARFSAAHPASSVSDLQTRGQIGRLSCRGAVLGRILQTYYVKPAWRARD